MAAPLSAHALVEAAAALAGPRLRDCSTERAPMPRMGSSPRCEASSLGFSIQAQVGQRVLDDFTRSKLQAPGGRRLALNRADFQRRGLGVWAMEDGDVYCGARPSLVQLRWLRCRDPLRLSVVGGERLDAHARGFAGTGLSRQDRAGACWPKAIQGVEAPSRNVAEQSGGCALKA